MAVSAGYREYVCDRIAEVKPVVASTMFGGVGLYVEGWLVALIDDDTLYFKVDCDNVRDYIKAGMEPFQPFGEGSKPMHYFELPADVLENPFEMEIWLRKSLQAARDRRARTRLRPASRNQGRRGRSPAILLAILAGISSPVAGQGGTDIFMAPLSRAGERLIVGTPTNATARPGYDNQPAFTPDGAAILFSSARPGGQTDILRYNLASRRTEPVTRTPENEYSPTVTPDGTGFTVIRDTSQFLTRFSLDGSSPRIVFERIRPVGYHAWLDANTAVLFVLGAPATLQMADTRTGDAVTLAWDIGRSLHKVPGKIAGSFAQRMPDGAVYIMELDPATRAMRPLVRALEGSQDYAWTPWGGILMARGNVLYEWHPSRSAGWQQVARFEDPALARISRLAVSPVGDWVALVADEPAP
ncbi:MAG: TfoX/Sxy family protein [Gemmatimonadota bacterium]|nr:TfoX/Sxy family protein [Gemmatimonadota bacterium]